MMHKPPPRARRALARDRRGITSVEFAMLLPVMLTLIFGSIEVGHLMSIRANLEGSLMEASRLAAAQLHLSEGERDTLMRKLMAERVGEFTPVDGEDITIETEVYRDFSSSYPEPFEDVDGNKAYTPGSTTKPPEPFDDRNNNGKWDDAAKLGGKFGGPGDVVGYKATFPAPLYFTAFFAHPDAFRIDLTATSIRRNEPEAKLST